MTFPIEHAIRTAHQKKFMDLQSREQMLQEQRIKCEDEIINAYTKLLPMDNLAGAFIDKDCNINDNAIVTYNK